MSKKAPERETASESDSAELATLYVRYGFLLRRRCRMILGDEASAEDALQDVFVKVLDSPDALRQAENPLAWLYRVVDHACFDQLRKRRHRRSELLEDHEEASMCHPNVEIEARNAVVRILDSLDEEEAQVAVLAYIDGIHQTEIASMLGLSRPTIWKRLNAVRERASRILGIAP